MGTEGSQDHLQEPPSDAPLPPVDIVVYSMAGHEVVRSSLDCSVTIASLCGQVAEEIGIPAARILLQCGSLLCNRGSTLAEYVGDDLGDGSLEFSHVVGKACIFDLASFTGTGDLGSMSKYDWRGDYDPADGLTIMCWVKTKSGGYHYLVSRGEWTEGYSLGVLAESDRRGTLRGWLGKPLFSRTTIAKDRWYHIAFTFDGTASHVYVNGELEGSSSCRMHPGHFTQTDLFIGGEALGLGKTYKSLAPRHFLNGDLRDLGVYSEALSAEDIQAEFLCGAPDDRR